MSKSRVSIGAEVLSFFLFLLSRALLALLFSKSILSCLIFSRAAYPWQRIPSLVVTGVAMLVWVALLVAGSVEADDVPVVVTPGAAAAADTLGAADSADAPGVVAVDGAPDAAADVPGAAAAATPKAVDDGGVDGVDVSDEGGDRGCVDRLPG